ncbi:MAG: flagellar assembly protein FliW [Phycisphaerales bacterium]
MEIRTSRFGTVEVDDAIIITFPKGLLGFPEHTRFCLLRPADDSAMLWLQSCDDPGLAFVVTDPGLFVKDYHIPIRSDQMDGLRLDSIEDAQLLVIVNKVDSVLTGNLQGPLVINTTARIGDQLVLIDKRWTTRHPLVETTLSKRQAIPA